jgi:purine-binding chemotaxis protein CheW
MNVRARPSLVHRRFPHSAPAGDSLLTFADAILARPSAPAPAPATEVQAYLTFCLQRAEFGVPILRSREIVRVGEITRIPEAPPHVRGVLNLRGRVVPVVELRTRLGLPVAALTPQSRVIVVEAYGRLFGLLVDRAWLASPRSQPAQSSPHRPRLSSATTDHVTGIAQMGTGLITLLDLDKVLLLNPTAPQASDFAARSDDP